MNLGAIESDESKTLNTTRLDNKESLFTQLVKDFLYFRWQFRFIGCE